MLGLSLHLIAVPVPSNIVCFLSLLLLLSLAKPLAKLLTRVDSNFAGCIADGPVKHLFNKTVDRAVGTGARAKLARAAADNAIWMPVTTCLLFAGLKLAQGQPEEIASGLQVSLLLLSSSFLFAV